MKKRTMALVVALGMVASTGLVIEQGDKTVEYKTIYLPSDKYPSTSEHIQRAIDMRGKTNICTIDRKGAEENRKESLKGIATKYGYDRDEFPMAMCEEGGKGADVEYVLSRDNRGSGSWISHQVEDLKDGEKFKIEVK